MSALREKVEELSKDDRYAHYTENLRAVDNEIRTINEKMAASHQAADIRARLELKRAEKTKREDRIKLLYD